MPQHERPLSAAIAAATYADDIAYGMDGPELTGLQLVDIWRRANRDGAPDQDSSDEEDLPIHLRFMVLNQAVRWRNERERLRVLERRREEERIEAEMRARAQPKQRAAAKRIPRVVVDFRPMNRVTAAAPP